MASVLFGIYTERGLNQCRTLLLIDYVFTHSGPIAACHDWLKPPDSVEKVAPLSGLRQNLCIGQQGSTQHDGTVIEWAGAAVLLVQP